MILIKVFVVVAHVGRIERAVERRKRKKKKKEIRVVSMCRYRPQSTLLLYFANSVNGRG
jgi:hypothetical protein